MKKLSFPKAIRACIALSLFVPLFISSCQKESNTSPDSALTSKAASLSVTNAATVTSKSVYKLTGPISLVGVNNITIRGDSINGGTVPCISLVNCTNIRITHCKLLNSKTLGVNISNCTSVKVDSSYISNVSTGVYAVDSKSIQVQYNQMKNMQGPYPKGAFVQFDNVSGGNNRVNNNMLENILGASYPEDAISMYKSNGLSTDPIYVSGNWIRGGGPSKTGGGIMLGDNGGSYQVAAYNRLVNPGQYGVAISGGTHMQIFTNDIYSKSESFSNVGLYYWNQSGLPSSDITISGNKVNFTSGIYGVNNSYVGPSSPAITGWSSNVFGANINASLLPTTLITYK
jgi:hypothetical protein